MTGGTGCRARRTVPNGTSHDVYLKDLGVGSHTLGAVKDTSAGA